MVVPRRRFSVLATVCSLSCLGALPALAGADTSTPVNDSTTHQSTDVGHTSTTVASMPKARTAAPMPA